MSYVKEESSNLNESVDVNEEAEINYFQEIYNFLLRNEISQNIGHSAQKTLKTEALNYCVSHSNLVIYFL